MKNLKTGKGVLRRMKRILETPFHQRRAKFGRGWAWEITNGREIIREDFSELLPEMRGLFDTPKTVDDLVEVLP